MEQQASSTRPTGPSAGWTQRRRLSVVLALNVSLIGALILVGLASHSIGVLSAAGDTAVDSVALLLGLLAVIARDRDPNHPDAGRWIAPVALINGMALLAVTAFVALESIQRLREGAPQVHGTAMLIVSTITMVVLLGGAWILGAKAAHEDVHMRSVLLDTLADAGAAAAIAVAGLVIALTGRFYWLDPVLALVIGAVVIFAAASLIKDALAKLRGRDVVFDND